MRLEGFRCDMCGLESVGEAGYGGCPPRLTGHGRSYMWQGDGIYQEAYSDFCSDCFKKVCIFVKENGGKIHNEKSN